MQISTQGRAALLMNPKRARGDARLPDRYSSRFIASTNVCESPERKCHYLQGTYFGAPYWCFSAVFRALEQVSRMIRLRAMFHSMEMLTLKSSTAAPASVPYASVCALKRNFRRLRICAKSARILHEGYIRIG